MRIDLMKAPEEPWERREYLLSEFLRVVLKLSTLYVRDRYKSRELLENSNWFVKHDLMEAPFRDLSLFERVGYFPWREAKHDLCGALDQALLGYHRASFDLQRRSLELILVGAWFVSEQTTEEDAHAWMSSKNPTPRFNRMLQGLSKDNLYAGLEVKTSWVDEVQKFYWRLCNISHVRGVQNGLDAIQPRNATFDGWPAPKYSEEALEKALDSFVDTISYIALLIALSNPVLLSDLPIEEKFGINGPASGFYEEGQAENLRELIPEKHRDVLVNLAKADDHVVSVRDWVSSRPDLTAEQLEKQFDDFSQ